jgi:ELWxxDGT repeat protein
MKQNLRIFAVLTLVLLTLKTRAQLTNLSNNTNIRSGVALGSIGVLADKDGLLYTTDGTAAGTASYANLKVRIDTTVQYVIMNGKIYFTGIDVTDVTGRELWVTDGTDGGTQLIKDIYPGTTNSSPRDLFVFNNAVYFFAKTAAHGVELWKSDGTLDGTVEVKDINPGADNGYNDNYTSFFANNNILYFDATDGTNGVELWKTDGTNTAMVKDINSGAPSSNAENFTALGTEVLFSATDATNGTELWKTDGTTTVLVQNIASGANSSSPSQFVLFQNKIFFAASTGSGVFAQGGLYSTDGNSVILVKSFGIGGSATLLSLSVILNNKLVFSALTIGASGTGLQVWASDGTTAGTTAITNLNTSNPIGAGAIILPDIFSAGANGDYHTHSFNNKIFFIADDGTHGAELWITDGTQANIVKDINPGADSSLGIGSGQFAASWFYTANTFYFSANDGTHGNELWKTDGTGANTSLVQDLNPNGGSSDPFMFMFLNSHIYLTADNGDNADEDRDLYIMDASVTLPVSLVNFTATLNNKAVDLNWATASEINTKNYTIQRSSNGRQFQNIGSVNAVGNSNKNMSYHFTDADALQTGADKIYYRLQINDNDGKITYSPVASVNMLPNGNLLVLYPNPVKDNLVLILNKAADKATIRISNANGKVVLVKQFENLQAGAQNKINVATLGKGVYYLEFISDNNKQTTRFIKY